MNCVSPTPDEAQLLPTPLSIIQQTLIEHMLYAEHCVKWFAVTDTKTTQILPSGNLEFNSIPQKPRFPTYTSLCLTKSVADLLKAQRRMAPESLNPLNSHYFSAAGRCPDSR